MISTGLIVGGIVLYVNYKNRFTNTTNDHGKIVKIADSCKLYVKDSKGNKKTIRIRRRSRIEGGMEYVYQIPLGMSFSDFQAKLEHFQDGLNVSHKWKELKFDRTIFKQLKDPPQRARKEVVMDFDGMLKVKVYDRPIPERFDLTDELLEKCKGWEIPLGMSRDKFLKHDMELGHMVVAGLTRGGKTVFLKSLITSLIARKPEDAQFALIDLKGGLAFARFKDCSQVKYMAYDAESAQEVLQQVTNDMKRRWHEFRSKGYEDIGEAGIKERIFVIVDEGAEISSQGYKGTDKELRVDCERSLSEIARLGAGLGYRLIYATQYPTADVLPRQVKQNSPTRICFRVATDTASDVVLDQVGAEKLPDIKGRAMVVRNQTEIVQCPYIDNGFINDKIKIHIRSGKREHTDPDKKAGAAGEYPGFTEEA